MYSTSRHQIDRSGSQAQPPAQNAMILLKISGYTAMTEGLCQVYLMKNLA